MPRVYCLSIRWVTTPINPILMDGVVGMLGDWIRLSAFTWYVSTTKSAADIRQLLSKHLLPDDSFIISPVEVRELDGWAPAWIWQWLVDHNEERLGGPDGVPLPTLFPPKP